MLLRSANEQMDVMVCPFRSGLEADEISQHIGFFGGAAFAAQHVLTVAAKPFVNAGAVRENLRIEGRRQRLDDFAGAGVLALLGWRGAVATGARPITALLGIEKHPALLRLARLTGGGAPLDQLLGWRGLGSHGLRGHAAQNGEHQNLKRSAKEVQHGNGLSSEDP